MAVVKLFIKNIMTKMDNIEMSKAKDKLNKATKNNKTPKKISKRPKMTEEEWNNTEYEILKKKII